jgi:hypothetical protein
MPAGRTGRSVAAGAAEALGGRYCFKRGAALFHRSENRAAEGWAR